MRTTPNLEKTSKPVASDSRLAVFLQPFISVAGQLFLLPGDPARMLPHCICYCHPI